MELRMGSRSVPGRIMLESRTSWLSAAGLSSSSLIRPMNASGSASCDTTSRIIGSSRSPSRSSGGMPHMVGNWSLKPATWPWLLITRIPSAVDSRVAASRDIASRRSSSAAARCDVPRIESRTCGAAAPARWPSDAGPGRRAAATSAENSVPLLSHTEHLAGRRVFARHRDQPVDKPVDLTAEARGEQGAVIPACQLVPAEAKEPFGGGVGQGDAAVPGHIQDRVGAGIQDRAEYRHC
jgi:hypothetical protein